MGGVRWVMSYTCLVTNGIPISLHILRMLVRFTIPCRDKAAYMHDIVYCLKTNQPSSVHMSAVDRPAALAEDDAATRMRYAKIVSVCTPM